MMSLVAVFVHHLATLNLLLSVCYREGKMLFAMY